ncbi:MAG: Cysteine sulfinate desulfinase/cysteine desulfurase [Chthonomonadales bacterium]|nr:Cysteine sulfinate desulfinase/cysteine desulfurase [Chthonomonadales bacterium]
MLPYFTERFGNASALYSVGAAARDGVENAREVLAAALHASPDEIVFTSGGTEADNMALRGAAEANPQRRHLLTTPIEHHAVLEPLERLQHQGYELEILPVDGDGRVDFAAATQMLRSDTLLVSVMHANNEIGTIQDIAAFGTLCRAHGILFHTDAVQSFGKLPIDVRKMQIDMLSLSGHKLHAPKGVGALYVRRGTPLARFMEGGGQERGRRGGTLNVPGIVGLGKATELAHAQMESETARLTELRDWFFERLTATIPGVRICGSRVHRMPNNIHFCLDGVQGEPVLLALDAAGICASAGSACSAGSTEPSHVLKAICVPREQARGALRLTMGGSTDQAALEYTLETLSRTVSELRLLSGSTERH